MTTTADPGAAATSKAHPSVPTQLWIGGGWVDARDGRTFTTVNPATGEVIAEVAEARPPRH